MVLLYASDAGNRMRIYEGTQDLWYDKINKHLILPYILVLFDMFGTRVRCVCI